MPDSSTCTLGPFEFLFLPKGYYELDCHFWYTLHSKSQGSWYYFETWDHLFYQAIVFGPHTKRAWFFRKKCEIETIDCSDSNSYNKFIAFNHYFDNIQDIRSGLMVHVQFFTENCKVESFHSCIRKVSVTFQFPTRNLYNPAHLPIVFQQKQLLVKRKGFKQVVILFPLVLFWFYPWHQSYRWIIFFLR